MFCVVKDMFTYDLSTVHGVYVGALNVPGCAYFYDYHES